MMQRQVSNGAFRMVAAAAFAGRATRNAVPKLWALRRLSTQRPSAVPRQPSRRWAQTQTVAADQEQSADRHHHVTGVRMKDRTVALRWGDGHVSEFHFLWLRHNCPCPQCLHPTSHQKLITAADIPLETHPLQPPVADDSTLSVTWSLHGGDRHQSTFSLPWLRAHCRTSKYRTIDERSDMPVSFWDGQSESRIASVPFEDYVKSDRALWKAVEGLHRHGIAFVRQAPREDGMVKKIASRIGPIRNTFYGEHWEVKYEPSPENVASSSLALPLHMDLQYFESPPGLQLLHCLHAAKEGGATQFVDGFLVAQRLREKSPASFRLLTQVPISFIYRASDRHMAHKHPLIKLGPNDTVQELHYSPPWEAPLDVPNDVMDDFYRAYAEFEAEASDPSLLLSIRIKPGDCVIFNNRRVLHARTAFDPAHHRLLNGTYVDKCDFLSRISVLRQQLGDDVGS